MSATTIEWATHVWNPFTGCDVKSPGCARCYALTMAKRLKAMGNPRYQNDGDPRTSGPGFGFTVHWDKLEQPEAFPAGARVFVNSMSDVFHEQAPIEAIAALWAAFAEQPAADFLILTKRPDRMLGVLRSHYFALCYIAARSQRESWARGGGWPLENVWLGVSVENRRFVGRADLLRETPAAVRFISAEPLLGPLVHDGQRLAQHGGLETCWQDLAEPRDALGRLRPQPAQLDLTGIDWLIVGGESGPRHRPIHAEWACDLRDACLRQQWTPRPRLSTAFFFKQWGGRTPAAGGRELDGRTWDEFPTPGYERRGELVAARGTG